VADFRSSASFGKRQEYVVVGELLKRDFDVYMTLVDDQQIDCVVRIEKRRKPVYLDIQIKARSKSAKHIGLFAGMKIEHPRKNFVYVFFSEEANTYWLIPSKDLARLASRNKQGLNQGKYSVTLVSKRKNGEIVPNKSFDYWKNKWDILHDCAASLAP